MLGPSFGDAILLLVMWLIPFVVAIWVLRTLARISNNMERMAAAVETIAAGKSIP
jgi:hypothetical protein